MDSDRYIIPAVVIGILLTIILLVMGSRSSRLKPERFAKTVLSQNKKVFERLADM